MFWANVLHMYQPPTQGEEILHRIVKESYAPLIEALEKTPQVKITLNITACLTEFLAKLGYPRLISSLAAAARRGQVEFLASAKYHAILPLIPLPEARRQISLNLITNRTYFGDVYAPRGVFLPEMAYSREVGELISDLGFEYLILDELAFDDRFGDLSFDRQYWLEGRPNLTIFFRNRGASDAISFAKINTPDGFTRLVKRNTKPSDTYVITAMDGETYGHHRKGLIEVLMEVYQQPGIFIPVTLSELLRLPKSPRLPKESVNPLSSNWSASPEDLASGKTFALWKDPTNDVHKWQWELVNQALHTFHNHAPIGLISHIRLIGSDEKWEEVRDLLDRGLHSDQFWWASGYELRVLGKTIMFWSREMIEKGAQLLLSAVLKTPGVLSAEVARARDCYLNINESAERWEKKHPL